MQLAADPILSPRDDVKHVITAGSPTAHDPDHRDHPTAPVRVGRRLVALAVSVLCAAACSSCGGSEAPSAQRADAVRSADAAVPDCDQDGCQTQTAELASALGGLPGVQRVTDVTYHPADLSDVASVRGELYVSPDLASTGCAGLQEQVARLLWASAVSPLQRAVLDCHQAPSARDYDHLDVDLTAYDPATLASWGPRGG